MLLALFKLYCKPFYRLIISWVDNINDERPKLWAWSDNCIQKSDFTVQYSSNPKVPEHDISPSLCTAKLAFTFISFENVTKFCWFLRSVFSHEWIKNSKTWQNIQANIPGGRAVNTSKFIVNFRKVSLSHKPLPNRKALLRTKHILTWTSFRSERPLIYGVNEIQR